jgi:uncharacterized protein YoxC
MLESKLDDTECMLKEQEATSQNLFTKNDVLELKCKRLKEYIQKLTAKCEEWATSYHRQSQAIQQMNQHTPLSSVQIETPSNGRY